MLRLWMEGRGGGGGDGEWMDVVGKTIGGPEWEEEDGMYLLEEVREVGGVEWLKELTERLAGSHDLEPVRTALEIHRILATSSARAWAS